MISSGTQQTTSAQRPAGAPPAQTSVATRTAASQDTFQAARSGPVMPGAKTTSAAGVSEKALNDALDYAFSGLPLTRPPSQNELKLWKDRARELAKENNGAHLGPRLFTELMTAYMNR